MLYKITTILLLISRFFILVAFFPIYIYQNRRTISETLGTTNHKTIGVFYLMFSIMAGLVGTFFLY